MPMRINSVTAPDGTALVQVEVHPEFLPAETLLRQLRQAEPELYRRVGLEIDAPPDKTLILEGGFPGE